MEFRLNDEQRALQDAVRSFLRGKFDLAAVRKVYDDPDAAGNPAELWKALGEQGWLAVLVPEEYDGLGLGLLDAAVIARCLGAGAVPGAYASTLLAGEAIRLAGSPEQQQAWLPRVAGGEVCLTMAFRAEGNDWSVSGAAFGADRERLTGRAPAVEYAAAADAIVAVSRDGGLWIVDPKSGGAHVTPVPALDRTTRLADVTLSGVAAERLAGSNADIVAGLLNRGAVLAAADLTGIAREALTRTVQYGKDRVQFGVPVGSFQAIKHAMADLGVAVTMAEHTALYAAYALDTGAPDAGLAVSVAKAKASDTAREATAAMIQFHGGIGFTWEHDTHLFYKRAKRLEYAYGDASAHRERIAAMVVPA
ncbi:MAG TPA: acyl-CoA dehydrogenase family protein [Frankiaceae bacterium]|nr:acyl-CoA dehydrogenase family protein [Frankiaceae bacterium]